MNAPGDLVDGRFELVERLGSGGMGTVWRARDTVLHREVALKAVRSDADTVGLMRERVLREARALARLSHPHVVTIHQIVAAEPHPWIVMELVPGSSLQQRLDQGPLTPVAAARIGRQVLAALRAAHAAGIQHRDVKPANILLRPDGNAVLTDFGIAAVQGTTGLTATGELVGSPEYMAPERIRGHGDDPSADLWSLGVVLYVCAEGVSPLRRPTTLATLAAVLDDPLPPPTRSGPLTPVLEALLVRDPSARPDAARLDAMLAEVESGRTPHWAQPTMTAATPHPLPPTPTRLDTPHPTVPQQLREPRRRIPLLMAATAALAITAATTLTLVLRPGDTDGDNKAGTTTAPTAATPAPTTAGPSPAPSPTPDGRWIAQLHSEPLSSGTAARDRRLATIRQSVPEATVLRSDDYASLRRGYWVFYAPGPFTDGRAALTFCAERGRTSANACIGRYLSTDATDFAFQCRPPATAPTGRCTRTG
ncbi:serine/threonine protein kinase [Streptomyces sp. ISL-22]|uniref:serine/threonine-protein kinase n=1 Tax=unclassified Streptomyces TaxID=2593676 RepID=UPI001BE6E15D|nr:MULTISPECIES: serine/threonine-protein kinase [unclassified Streptomyces]MBT2421190.1 serine/threonine protein kinase [Streptomyces sp. ISL-24]MBT2432833.1 serine/threonine protein kinase [Streptomyces sp. ISL-22]